MRMLWKKVVEKLKTHILCSITFSEDRAVYEIMSKNLVKLEATNGVTIWRIRGACWISKTTHTRAHAHAHAPRNPRIHVRTQRTHRDK